MKDLWTAVDRYFEGVLFPDDPVLTQVLAACGDAGLPPIQISPGQGMLLFLLARIQGASKILEFGTLGGYSGIWLARALGNGGQLVTLEADPQHARVAASNFERAGLSGVVDLRVGPALKTLSGLREEGCGPFDFFFIDADKKNIPHYLAWSLKLARPGSVIVVDNIVQGGAVIEKDKGDEGIQGVRRMFEMISEDPGLAATAIQTVGRKGYDGFLVALVEEEHVVV